MDHDRVVSGIQRRARLHGPRETGRAVRAVLEGLAEIIPAPVFGRIVARLPEELRLRPEGRTSDGALVNSRTFIARIADRLHVNEPDAAFLARVVFEHLNETTHGVTPSTIAYLAPVELRPLLNAHAPDVTARPLPVSADVGPYNLNLTGTLDVDTVISVETAVEPAVEATGAPVAERPRRRRRITAG